MNRRLHLIVTAAFVGLAVIGAVLIIWRITMDPAPTITLAEAEQRAARYATEAVAQIPSARLEPRQHLSIPCQDLNGDTDQVDLGVVYNVIYSNPDPDTDAALSSLLDYWTAQGYRLTSDERTNRAGQVIRFTNPADNFGMSLTVSDDRSLTTLAVSAPCMWPNGLPT